MFFDFYFAFILTMFGEGQKTGREIVEKKIEKLCLRSDFLAEKSFNCYLFSLLVDCLSFAALNKSL